MSNDVGRVKQTPFVWDLVCFDPVTPQVRGELPCAFPHPLRYPELCQEPADNTLSTAVHY